MALPAACGVNGILATASKTDLKVEPPVLGDLLFNRISNGHVLRLSCREGLIYTYSANI